MKVIDEMDKKLIFSFSSNSMVKSYQAAGLKEYKPYIIV